MNPDEAKEWIDVVKHAAMQIGTLLAMALAALAPFAKTLIPFLSGFFKDKKAAQAFAAVSRAALVASSEHSELREKLTLQAKDPNSPGGKEITPEEKKDIEAKALLAGWQSIKREKLDKQVMDIYGGEEEVFKSIRAAMRHKANKTEDMRKNAAVA